MPIGEPSWYTDRNPLDGIHLKPPYEDEPAFVLEPLPSETRTVFRVGLLSDRPQNPILDTLNLSQNLVPRPPRDLPSTVIARDNHQSQAVDGQLRPEQHSNRALRWSSLKNHYAPVSKEAPLLSEQSNHHLSAIRYHIDPILKDPHTIIRYCTLEELLDSLCLVLTGLSSPLYVWDDNSESFRLRDATGNKEGTLILIGSDDVVGSSLLKRFLVIGTILRQLTSFEDRQNSSNPVLNAFASSIGLVLQYVADTIRANSPESVVDGPLRGPQSLTAWWSKLADLEAMLSASSALCVQFDHIVASSPSPSTEILSHIYNELNMHLNAGSPRLSKAMFAYILTMMSRVYFKQLASTVGYGILDQTDELERSETTLDDDDALHDIHRSQAYPSFFSPSAYHSITVAQKSLKLLKAAAIAPQSFDSRKPVHTIEWVWTSDALYNIFEDESVGSVGLHTSSDSVNQVPSPDRHVYPESLSQFETFDLDPRPSATLSSATFGQFLKVYPLQLPNITPSLQLLSQTVTSPLFTHVRSISKSLVDIFLSESSPYHLPTHLELLKSYLLMTSPAFKLQLQQALFAFGATASDQVFGGHYVAGLSPKLTADGSWPPAGSNLSLSLRTVILDALAQEYGGGASCSSPVTQKIIKEAEWRLGFAIQDLPVNSGHAQWLNSKAIQALDFLYLDYNPPKPLDAVITPSILSKYHRVFVFCLRLMRVESVLQSLSYVTKSSNHIQSQELVQVLQHFKFIANSFISKLCNYVLTHVIGVFFDKFLQGFGKEASIATFDNVEDLTNSHSQILDHILFCCLLRSSQKSTAKCLHSILETILSAGLLIYNFYMGLVLENYVLVQIKCLLISLSDHRSKLIKHLRKLNTQSNSSSQLEELDQISIATLLSFLN